MNAGEGGDGEDDRIGDRRAEGRTPNARRVVVGGGREGSRPKAPTAPHTITRITFQYHAQFRRSWKHIAHWLWGYGTPNCMNININF